MRKYLLAAIIALAAVVPASSSTFSYVSWTSLTTTDGIPTVLGTLPGGITVAYTGETDFAQLNGIGTNYYEPYDTVYTNVIVSNMPPNSDMIAIDGSDTVHTVTFSAPITGLIMDLVSLGQNRPGYETSYTFDQAFSILSMGPAHWGGPGILQPFNVNTTVTGIEGDGVIQFAGPVSTLSWTGASPEYWNGFTFATPTPIPEPATWGLMLAGLALAGLRRVRR